MVTRHCEHRCRQAAQQRRDSLVLVCPAAVREIAGRYQVMSIPTIPFFKGGQAVERLVGARPKRQFKEIIDSLLAQHSGTA